MLNSTGRLLGRLLRSPRWCRFTQSVFQGIGPRPRRRKDLGSLLRDQNGAVAVIIAASLIFIMGFGALALDMSYGYSTRNMLQVTATASAVAAAYEIPDQSQSIATALAYAEDNMPAANHGMVLASNDVVFGQWDEGTKTWTPGATPFNAVEVTTRRAAVNGNRLNLFLAPILGLESLDIATSAVAYAPPPTAWDVVLVQDVTGSFIDEIEDSKLADQALLDCVSSNFVNARMGLTTFSGTAPTLENPEVPPHVLVPMLPVSGSGNPNYIAMSDAISDIVIPTWQNRSPASDRLSPPPARMRHILSRTNCKNTVIM